MASPQTKNGYTRIANEILDNITRANLNGTQLRIIMVIWRYTYGFGRKSHEIPLTLIAEKVDTTKGHIDREITNLINRGFVIVVGIGKRRGRLLSFNKNYEEWDKPQQQEELKSPVKAEKPKKTKKQQYDKDNTYYKMALYFHERVKAVAKDAQVEHLVARANLQTWADDFRKLIEIDGIDKRLAKELMDWVTIDPFWKTNVLSAKKLREKFMELSIKMKAAKQPKQHAPQQVLRPDSRDKEIEFQRWVGEGNDPDAFDWSN